MKEPRFRTSKNRLTRYSLACGYIELAEFADGKELRRVKLEMEHGVLCVECYDRRPNEEYPKREFIDVPNLTVARKVFAAKCREYRVKFSTTKQGSDRAL